MAPPSFLCSCGRRQCLKPLDPRLPKGPYLCDDCLKGARRFAPLYAPHFEESQGPMGPMGPHTNEEEAVAIEEASKDGLILTKTFRF